MEREVSELLKSAPDETILKSFVKTYSMLNSKGYRNIFVSISGGSDSDIILDMCIRLDYKKICHYVWINTGLEYEATKRHIDFLMDKYDIDIQEVKPDKNIIQVTREFGQPFLSKIVSSMISAFQRYDFEWEYGEFEDLYKKYGIKNTLMWWNNKYSKNGKGMFCINRDKYLKEFMSEYNPWFDISDKCCDYVKKKVVIQYMKDHDMDLDITGIRKSEGGRRSVSYKSCFLEKSNGEVLFMPIFWYNEKDKKLYEETYDIVHSDCYKIYGFKRTGCACCPFGGIKNVNEELKIIKKYEPKLYKVCKNIFADSYKYMRMYKDYRDKREGKPLDKLADGVERVIE